MNAGTPPTPGNSRMTVEIYRVGPDGTRTGPTRRRTYQRGPGPLTLVSDRWPPCRCPRCLSGRGPRP